MFVQAFKDTLYFNPFQVHRLVTHEDGDFFHAHKIFGILGLGNFFYRIGSQALYRTHGYTKSIWTLFFIGVHAMMHISSFEFLIPSRRNRVYNIIWPEMRWHSLVFAYRSLILMMVLYLSWLDYIPAIATVYIRGPLVFLTMMTADQITEYYKSTEKTLKEDETTMRSNPYPSYVPTQLSRWYNLMYSTSQVFGTINILCRDMGSIFLVVFPIQIAPFGMTLVKKGLITQAGWHLWYSFAIFANYWYAKSIERHTQSLEWFYIAATLFFCTGRFAFRLNKYMLWGIVILTQMYLLKTLPEFYDAIAIHGINHSER